MSKSGIRPGKRKICVVTGSRAEYGLLYWVMKELQADPSIELQIAVTGTHLSHKHGYTAEVIDQDGFDINERIELDLSHDSDVSIGCALGTAVTGFTQAFAGLKPDIIVLLGDRYEIFAAAAAAMILKNPVAHIAGGDVTEGAYDDAMRHSITKMSHIHFVTNKEAGHRVRQLGEDPAHIFVVGSPGLDQLTRTQLLSRNEVESKLGLTLSDVNILVTFHPATLDSTPPNEQFKEILLALDELPSDWNFIFTRPNADAGGSGIDELIDAYVAKRQSANVFTSLGQKMYLSVMALCDVVVGNSSSGLYEAPSLMKPTVNIGDRQHGRIKASSVIDCEPRKDEIKKSILQSVTLDYSSTVNPYGDGRSVPRIVGVLRNIKEPQTLIKKHFFDLDGNSTDNGSNNDMGADFVNLMNDGVLR